MSLSAFNHPLLQVVLTRILERAVRLELTNTGFAIRRLSRLATRAEWNGRRDSNSRIEFGRLACFPLHHFRERRKLKQLAPRLWGEIIVQKWNSWQALNPHPRRSKRRALPFELQEQGALPIVDLRLPIDSVREETNRKSAIRNWQ